MGALGSSIATPLDLMKIRFQSYSSSNPNPYRHTLHAFIATVRTSGVTGLYKGVGPDHSARRHTEQLVALLVRPQQVVADSHWTLD